MKATFFKRALIVALALIMLLSVVSCKDKSADVTTNDGANDGSDTTPVDNTVYFDIVKDGVCVPVKYGYGADGDEIQCAKTVAERINRITGAVVDWNLPTAYDPNAVEIVVGRGAAGDYPEMADAVEMLGYGEGLVKMIGNKLIIVGADNDSLDLAITEMVKKFNEVRDDNNNIRIPATFECSAFANKLVGQMPVYESYSPKIVDRNNDCYSLEFGTKKQTFENYIELMTQNGFELYASKTIDGNVYKTYVNDESGVVATSIYTKFNNNCRLLIEWLADTELPTKAADNKYESLCESTITQVGLWYANASTPLISPPNNEGREFYNYFNGMSYVIRLADGSFIIVDGGHNNTTSVDNLYNILKAQAIDSNNIVIAAWFISHDHEDHTGLLNGFLAKYKDNIDVERFIFNFPGAELGNTSGTDKALRSRIKGFCPEAKIVKAHPGQEFNIRNAKITMLYTMDVYFKDTLDDTNNASIVWQMELNGKTFLSLGDYSESATTLLSLYSAETLKSDIMQLAHHGISGMGNSSLYSKVNAEYVFWPVANLQLDWNGIGGNKPIDLTQGSHGAMNQLILNMDQSKVFIARDDVYVMTIGTNGAISTSKYETVNDYVDSVK